MKNTKDFSAVFSSIQNVQHPSPLLEIRQLSYFSGKKPLIESISLSLSPGCLHAFLGLNGSGKSTLLRTIARIWQPSYGSVLIQGKDTSHWERRRLSRTLSLVPQTPSIPFNYRVEEMIRMGYYSADKNGSLSIDEALSKVDALHLRDRPILSLSAGERQRIYIARSLVTSAPILLFDEPTSSLDLRHQLEVWRLLKNLALQGHLVIIATHDLAAAKSYCDSVSLLQSGCCFASGHPETVLNTKNIEKIFNLDSSNSEALQLFGCLY